MKHLTTAMRSMTTLLLLFVMIGVSTAWAQTTTRYVERNGVGDLPCAIEEPCDLPTAFSGPDNIDTVFVRVRESGAMTRIDEDFVTDGDISIGIYDEDDEDVTSGMIAIEGDVKFGAKGDRLRWH